MSESPLEPINKYSHDNRIEEINIYLKRESGDKSEYTSETTENTNTDAISDTVNLETMPEVEISAENMEISNGQAEQAYSIDENITQSDEGKIPDWLKATTSIVDADGNHIPDWLETEVSILDIDGNHINDEFELKYDVCTHVSTPATADVQNMMLTDEQIRNTMVALLLAVLPDELVKQINITNGNIDYNNLTKEQKVDISVAQVSLMINTQLIKNNPDIKNKPTTLQEVIKQLKEDIKSEKFKSIVKAYLDQTQDARDKSIAKLPVLINKNLLKMNQSNTNQQQAQNIHHHKEMKNNKEILNIAHNNQIQSQNTRVH